MSAKPDEEPAEVLYPETNDGQHEFCTAVCGCGTDDENQWTLTRSMACLVASGCVVLPSEDFEEAATETRPITSTSSKPPPAVQAQ
mmetsp:Transcript_3546/g.5415  ORF Transcript_3546/g.5415 Transcript_3546/m.5415 type:complete len:86 (-) Transcript_3546:403-660(-)